MIKYILTAVLLLSVMSCMHMISAENRQAALLNIPFSVIREDVERHSNGLFIFGGIIVETIHTKEGAEIEIVQSPLDRWGNIISRDNSDGRFIITVGKHLDPLIFKQGRELIMAGVLTGSRTKALAGSDYVYPVFEAREIHLRPEEMYPPPAGYDPYYTYPYYWQDPFWFRPHLYFHYRR